MSLARRQRREMAKHFGLLSKNETVNSMRERLQRSQKMGNQIHIQHLQRVQNDIIESKRSRQVSIDDQLATSISMSNDIATENITLNPVAFDFLKNLPKEEPLSSMGENGTDVND